MKRTVIPAFLWIAFVAMPATGQDAIRVDMEALSKSAKQHATWDHQHDPAVCGTVFLMDTPGWRESLRAYHEAREAGLLPTLGKGSGAVAIGDTMSFNINEAESGASPNFKKRPFILRAEAEREPGKPGYRIWTDIPEADTRPIRDEEIEAFARSLVDVTPVGSINPEAGTLGNNESIFGEPGDPFGGTPNFDGDGITDFLIYEIPSPAGLTIVGFFSPTDINPSAPDNISNKGDFLYLHREAFDRVGTSNVHSVAAHEYQHLIHARFDQTETAFVNEGLSELAQSVNGYPAEVPFFLFGSNPEYNVPLMQYRRGETEVLNDYARASLFTNYLAEQLGIMTTGAITRNRKSGYAGYRDVVAGSSAPESIDELVANYHTANYANDLTIGKGFGYANAQRQAEVRVSVPQSQVFDGSGDAEIRNDTLIVEPGGVEYLVWEDVEDLIVNVDAAVVDALLALRREQILLRAVLYPIGASAMVTEFRLSEEPITFEGQYESIALVIAHVRPEATRLPVEFSASWNVDEQRQVVSVQYDDGTALQSCGTGGCAFSFGAGADGGHATRFAVPAGAALSEVAIANYYLSQFSNGGQPQNAPRDFALTVWAGNGQGFPGQVLFQMEVEDPRPFSAPPPLDYDHAEINLEEFVDQLFPLPDTIYVGTLESGNDQNFMVALPDRYAVENVSLIRGSDQFGNVRWTRLWDVTFAGQSNPDARPLNWTVLPTRAVFVIDQRLVAVDGEELPTGFELEQNYPNPFNPATTIRFSLATASQAKLAVYDVTGRQVALLADGERPAGTYQVTVDASDWASGMYLYTLDTADGRQTRRMLLLK